MNQESLQKELDSYIQQNYVNNKEFQKIEIKGIVTLQGNADGVSVQSNAGLTYPGSFVVKEELSQFVKQKLLDNAECRGAKLEITFSKKDKKENTDTPTRFVCSDPKYQLSDVILSEEKRNEIQNALALIENHQLIYNEWGWKEKEPSAKSILCFYGAPGTGKTMCAHGIANYLNKKILIASYADIQSEYVGVGPKNLKAIFQQAEMDDAVLFFDEADSFLRKRTSDTSSSASMHYNSMTNEMMKHLEDFNGLVIFATNLTENTDEAFKTRITCSIEFVVPDEAARAEIISYMIPKQVPTDKLFSEDDFLSISKACDGFVGRDIRNAVKSVLNEGARTGSYPFTVDSFIEGFKHYKETKDQFGDSIDGKKKDDAISQIDTFTENGKVLSLLSYVAWIDGEESDEETEKLKEKAKLLGRNKIIIRKLADLAPIEEICEGIKHDKTKINAVFHVADVLAVSGEDESNISLLHEIVNLLGLDEKVEIFDNYYGVERQRVSVVKSISETKGE